jgi:hypothetical protein
MLNHLPTDVKRHAVGQVTAHRQVHAEDGVAGLEEGEEHGLVCLRAGVRLDIGGIGAEQLLGPVDGQLLDHIHVLAAAVVALARIPLGILVGQLRTLGFHHGPGDVVLRGDQLDVVFLAAVLVLDRGPEFRIALGKGVLLGKHFLLSKKCFSEGWREASCQNQNIRLRIVLVKASAWRFAETKTWPNPWMEGNAPF